MCQGNIFLDLRQSLEKMSVFKNYSKYYDLLYQDKDYVGEVDYIINIIKKNHPLPKSILNLGCGTGKHDFILAKNGFEITAIDLSQEMIDMAKEKSNPDHILFQTGNINTLRLNKKFDVVISLFHVISYQITEVDLISTFRTAFEHLNSGGLFIFDFWYGPAVLTDRPEIKKKCIENEDFKIIRFSEPLMHSSINCVDINFQLIITEKNQLSTFEIAEKHVMRYWFKPEIEYFLKQFGFKVLKAEQWMTEKNLSFDTWYACFQVQKL